MRPVYGECLSNSLRWNRVISNKALRKIGDALAHKGVVNTRRRVTLEL
jgi:hypothetical protein